MIVEKHTNVFLNDLQEFFFWCAKKRRNKKKINQLSGQSGRKV